MSNGILVLCEHDGGVFKKTAAELLGKARDLGLGPVTALVLGHAGGAELGAYGATRVLTVTGPAFSSHDTGAFAKAIAAAIAAVQPAAVLAPSSPASLDGLPRVAARLGLGLANEITALAAAGGALVARRPMYGGRASAEVRISSSPALFTARPNSFGQPAGGGAPAPVEALAVDVGAGDLMGRLVDREAPKGSVADLTEADRIVSGGRSVKSADGYDKLIRPLAATIGATPGASRAAVDSGFAPHSHQVGQTGKTVNPSLYVAMGISGAIQHLAGMRTSKIIVAVNTDKDAPIFQHATYGIVGDMFEVGPLLQAELARAVAG